MFRLPSPRLAPLEDVGKKEGRISRKKYAKPAVAALSPRRCITRLKSVSRETWDGGVATGPSSTLRKSSDGAKSSLCGAILLVHGCCLLQMSPFSPQSMVVIAEWTSRAIWERHRPVWPRVESPPHSRALAAPGRDLLGGRPSMNQGDYLRRQKIFQGTHHHAL